MPVQKKERKHLRKPYTHIHNKGVENRNLFNDQEDYAKFLDYLSQYLSPPPDNSQLKKTFSVNGRSFKGVPHQPKNYFGKIELIAYSLMPDHFHLIVHQSSDTPIEKLIRSLSTRYAIYYNKKYNRRGSLFAGPYKSAETNDTSQLTFLTHYLHYEAENQKGVSSYEDYIGVSNNPWVKPQVVLAYLENYERGEFKGSGGYKKFLEKYDLSDSEEKAIESLIIDKLPKKNEYESSPQPSVILPSEPKPAFATVAAEPRQRIPEFTAISTMVFIMLFAVGYRNVTRSAIEEKTIQVASQPTQSPQVAGSETEESSNKLTTPINLASTPTPTPEVPEIEEVDNENTKPITDDDNSPIRYIVIKIDDGSSSVNLRKEPTTSSEIVGKATDSEKFELISQASGWYQIKLNDGSNAYVSSGYAQLEGGSH